MSTRALILFVIVAAGAILGSLLGALLAEVWSTGDFGVAIAVITTAALAGSAALFGLALPSVLQFVRCGSEHLGRSLLDLLPALLLLILGTAAAQWAVLGASPVATASSTSAPVQIVFGQTAAHDAVFVPFFPIEGTSNNCDPNQTDFGKAQQVTGPDVQRALTDLMVSLSHCVAEGKAVKIDVRGFASTSEFKGCNRPLNGSPGAPTISEHLNWKLAEARRQTVIAAVRRASRDIVIDPSPDSDRWSGPQQMRDNMQFYDRNADQSYNRSKGALTRRAEIIILTKGSCEPVE